MKYKNDKDLRYSKRESEIRKLKVRLFELKTKYKEKLEVPYQDGWDIYFDVAPAYKGTVFEEKVWEVLPYLMKIGWEGNRESTYSLYNRNILGYKYSGDSKPTLCQLDEETYDLLKISKDLFYDEVYLYEGDRRSQEKYKQRIPKFLDKLITYKEPCMVEYENYLDEVGLQEEAEIESKIKSLNNHKEWYVGKFNSTKGWRKIDRRKKRRIDKNLCKKTVDLGYFRENGFRDTFSCDKKDMWWWIY